MPQTGLLVNSIMLRQLGYSTTILGYDPFSISTAKAKRWYPTRPRFPSFTGKYNLPRPAPISKRQIPIPTVHLCQGFSCAAQKPPMSFDSYTWQLLDSISQAIPSIARIVKIAPLHRDL